MTTLKQPPDSGRKSYGRAARLERQNHSQRRVRSSHRYRRKRLRLGVSWLANLKTGICNRTRSLAARGKTNFNQLTGAHCGTTISGPLCHLVEAEDYHGQDGQYHHMCCHQQTKAPQISTYTPAGDKNCVSMRDLPDTNLNQRKKIRTVGIPPLEDKQVILSISNWRLVTNIKEFLLADGNSDSSSLSTREPKYHGGTTEPERLASAARITNTSN
ncbi:hypothetical protein BGW37DRAFT_287600 [Umbelopsis sp. PMI_123]|nr:hypothetical protein BGW37DRAFT_287600 [Umbelopsis sp. PMI_123]